MINFFKGHPTDSLLPVTQILKATQSLLTRDRPTDANELDRHPLTYGSDPGSFHVRKAVAEWSTKAHREEQYGSVDP